MYRDRRDTCEGCVFWERLHSGDLYVYEQDLMLNDDGTAFVGECRRRPPVFSSATFESLKNARLLVSNFSIADNVNDAKNQASMWPLTVDCDWCGEQEPRTGQMAE